MQHAVLGGGVWRAARCPRGVAHGTQLVASCACSPLRRKLPSPVRAAHSEAAAEAKPPSDGEVVGIEAPIASHRLHATTMLHATNHTQAAGFQREG